MMKAVRRRTISSALRSSPRRPLPLLADSEGASSAKAGKFQAMVNLGMTNSRMKDFFDLWSLAREFEFDGEALSKAIIATFERRGTGFPIGPPLALSDEFATDATKNTQWRAFLRKGSLTASDATFGDVVRFLRTFLGPLTDSMSNGEVFSGTWSPAGPWQRDL
jgi:Nucleotidyl transferase AbiEii toxin, Type IV TA system